MKYCLTIKQLSATSNGPMAWGRSHAIKAALVVGFLLLLLNLFGPRLDVKYDKPPSYNYPSQQFSAG